MTPRPKDSSWDEMNPSGSKNSARQHIPLMRESGDLDGASSPVVGDRQSGEGKKPHARAHTFEGSDASVVPGKSGNLGVTPKDSTEERDAANGNLAQRNASRIQGRQDALAHLERVGRRAKPVAG